MSRASWFKQAVTQPDNRTYEGAYIALAAVIGMVAFTILSLIALAWVDMLSERENNFSYGGLGGGIAAVIAALGGFLGGVGGFILMDRKGVTPPPGTTTTEEKSTVVTEVVAPRPPAVVVTPSAPAKKGRK